MAEQGNSLRAGIFMLISVALVIFVIIAISGMGRFTQKYETLQIVFKLTDDINGLRVGDDVRIGGMKVGSVRDIKIRDLKTDMPMIFVDVEIPEKYHVQKNASVGVRAGITGAATINFDSLGAGEPLAEGDYLIGKPDPFSSFTRELGDITPLLSADLNKFGATADETTATVKDLHQRLPEVSTSAVKMLDAIREFVGPSSTDFHTTVANLAGATTTIKEKMPGLVKQVEGILTKLDDTMNHANAAVVEIQKAIDNTRDLTGAARSILVDNKSKLESVVNSLKTTSDNLKYASIEIRHSPWRLLYQPKPEEVSNMEIYDSMRQFAEGAESLDSAASALRDAVKDKDADPVVVKKLMQQLDESFTHFQEVQQKLWKEVKE